MTPIDASYSDSLWEDYAEIDIVDVVVDIEAPELQPSYSYRVPEAIRNTLRVGDCVHIPFGGREALGYVLERRALPYNDPLCGKLKDILAVVEDAITINLEQIHLAKWISARYVCDMLSAIRCVAPAIMGSRVSTMVSLRDPALRGSALGDSLPQAHVIETLRSLDGRAELDALREAANIPGFASAYAALVKRNLLVETRAIARAKTVDKKTKAYTLGPAAEVLSSGGGGVGRRSPQQMRILNVLIARARDEEGPMPMDELLRAAEATTASLRSLLERGLVLAQEVTVRRAPIVSPELRTTPPTLTPGQAQAVQRLRELIDTGTMQTALLFGVTASGKTEVYLNAIAHTLSLGRSAIVLVPEIALTTQVVDVFVGRFGEQVAVLHSKLSEGERHDEWRRMQEGKARIVVGARSAIFAPVSNVGLIVMDEEHESSYKQENMPRYNAKELAVERARHSQATLLLGSATPSLETFYAATPHSKKASPPTPKIGESQGKSTSLPRSAPRVEPVVRIDMPQRIDNRPLPTIDVVDLREEFKQRRALFSVRLTDAIAERLARKHQIILFLNRRGYAQFVLCRDCGYVSRCPHCAVSLAFHAYDHSLRCHHCDHVRRAPQTCPDCGGAKIKAFGIGTEKVEEEILRLFPSARVARMDRDTTAQKGAHTRIVREFRKGESDILIGTQMVAKGLDFPNVTLVGVISADTSINLPDFRAAERTFQLLTQVAGRAGRGINPGEVIVQTFSPDHFAIQAARSQNYEAFYRQEILFREELRYPPFSRLVNLISSDAVEQHAESRATRLAAALERVLPKEVEMIGPSAAPLTRLKNQFRFHVALRAPVDTALSDLVRAALGRLSQSDRLSIHIDMDPLSMS